MACRLLIGLAVNPTREMLAAGLGGAVATAIDVTTLVLLVEQLGAPIAGAAFAASTAGAAACFAMNKYVAFRDRSPLSIRQVARFGMVSVATALLMAFAMQLVAVDLRVPYLAAKIVCAAVVFVVWTYPAQRRLVFRRPALAG